MGGNTKRFRGRRLAAVLGAAALSVLGAVGAAGSASADDFGNIDPDLTGSILIHKHVHQTAAPVTGSPDGATNIPSAPVGDVTFTAYRVTDIDLTTADGWEDVAAFVVPTSCSSAPAGTSFAGDATTIGSGEATIDALAVGAYIVCETDAPSTVVDRAQPFLVTIPFPYKRTGTPSESWLYDVNVYPKNGVAGVTKVVSPQPVTGLGLGSFASFPVTTDIPTIATDANFTHYWVQDPMDARLTEGTVSTVTVGGSPVDASFFSVTTVGTLVTLQFTTNGLAWLKTQAGGSVVTTFTAKVTTVGAGAISNSASFSAATRVGSVPATPDAPIAPSDPAYPGSKSAGVTQNWGDLAVHKVDAGELTTPVQGAVFEVWAAAAPYAADCDSTTTAGVTAIPVNGESTFTSNGSGLLLIPGLFVSDSKNATVGSGYRCYVLKEVAAPAGFILPKDGKEFTAVTVKTGATNTAVGYDAEIRNTRIQGVVLPMTGSNGIVVLSVAGLALIAAGLVLAFLARRRRQTA